MRLRIERFAATTACMFAFAASLAGGDLSDYGHPRRYALSLYALKERLSALFFITTDCPISNSYAPEIQRICSEYGPSGVSCDLIYVDPALTKADVEKHVKEFGYQNIPAISTQPETGEGDRRDDYARSGGDRPRRPCAVSGPHR